MVSSVWFFFSSYDTAGEPGTDGSSTSSSWLCSSWFSSSESPSRVRTLLSEGGVASPPSSRRSCCVSDLVWSGCSAVGRAVSYPSLPWSDESASRLDSAGTAPKGVCSTSLPSFASTASNGFQLTADMTVHEANGRTRTGCGLPSSSSPSLHPTRKTEGGSNPSRQIVWGFEPPSEYLPESVRISHPWGVEFPFVWGCEPPFEQMSENILGSNRQGGRYTLTPSLRDVWVVHRCRKGIQSWTGEHGAKQSTKETRMIGETNRR